MGAGGNPRRRSPRMENLISAAARAASHMQSLSANREPEDVAGEGHCAPTVSGERTVRRAQPPTLRFACAGLCLRANPAAGNLRVAGSLS